MSLSAFKEFAKKHQMPVYSTFEGNGVIEPTKGGDAIYFPKANCGALIPRDGEKFYFGDKEQIETLLDIEVARSSNGTLGADPKGIKDCFDQASKNMPDGSARKLLEHIAKEKGLSLYQVALEAKAIDQLYEIDIPTDELNIEPFPIDLSNVDIERPMGLAGEICDYLNKTAHRQIPLIYPVVALHALSLVAGERKGHHSGKLNLFTLAIAPSASGKEHGQGWFAQIASGLKLGGHITGGISSDVDMIRNLVDGNGRCCYRIDEIQGLFNAIKNKNANTYESKIGDLLLTLITSNMFHFNGNHRRQFLESIIKDTEALEKKLEKLKDATSDSAQADYAELDRDRRQLLEKREYIENGWPDPMVSMMGHSTPEELDGIVNQKTINNGLIGRCLLIRCTETRAKLNTARAESQSQYDSILERLEKVKHTRRNLTASPEAKSALYTIGNYYDRDEQRNHPTLGAIFARALEQVSKICNLLALEAGIVEAEHVKYAAALVDRSIKDIAFLMQKSEAQANDSTINEMIQHTRDLIRRKIGNTSVPPSQLKDHITKSYKRLKGERSPDGKLALLDYVIAQMTQAGELRYIEDGRKRRYELAKGQN